MTKIVEATKEKIRDLPISDDLRALLIAAGVESGVDIIRITSGGQCAKGVCKKRTGSTRHDLGAAADLQLLQGSRALDFTEETDRIVFEAFTEACARLGATGIGAGTDYMGPKIIHVGYGIKAIWGKKGRSANAPQWLKVAVRKGWSASGEVRLADKPSKAPTLFEQVAEDTDSGEDYNSDSDEIENDYQFTD